MAGARVVKAVGSGHSFTDIACTDGLLVDLSRMNRVLAVEGTDVTVEAGVTLHVLGEELAARGLALENQGDIDAQTPRRRPVHGHPWDRRPLREPLLAGGGHADRDRFRRAGGGPRGGRAGRGPGRARRPRGDLAGHRALRARVHHPPRGRAALAGRRAAPPRHAGGRGGPLRGLRLPLHAHRAHAHLGAHRPRAPAAVTGAGGGAGPDRGERRARPGGAHRPGRSARDPADQPAADPGTHPHRAPRRQPPRVRQRAPRALHGDGVRHPPRARRRGAGAGARD